MFLEIPPASPASPVVAPTRHGNLGTEWSPSPGKQWQPRTPFSPLTQVQTPLPGPDQPPPRGGQERLEGQPQPQLQPQLPSGPGPVRHPTTPYTRLLICMPSGVKISVDLVLESDVMSEEQIAVARAARRRAKDQSADHQQEAEQYYTTAAENAAKAKKKALAKIERAEAKRLEKRDRSVSWRGINWWPS